MYYLSSYDALRVTKTLFYSINLLDDNLLLLLTIWLKHFID